MARALNTCVQVRMGENSGARHVLSEVFKRIAQWKMGSMGAGMGMPDSPGAGGAPVASNFGGAEHFEL